VYVFAIRTDEVSIAITLLHKPKSGGGLWAAIEPNSKIRVPANGKPVILCFNVKSDIEIDWKSLKVSVRSKALASADSDEPFEKDPRSYITLQSRTNITEGSRGDIADSSDDDAKLSHFGARLFAPNKKFVLEAQVKAKISRTQTIKIAASAGPFISTCGTSQSKKLSAAELVPEPDQADDDESNSAPQEHVPNSFQMKSNLRVAGNMRAQKCPVLNSTLSRANSHFSSGR
jgi:hypothetical protein